MFAKRSRARGSILCSCTRNKAQRLNHHSRHRQTRKNQSHSSSDKVGDAIRYHRKGNDRRFNTDCSVNDGS
eukprot:1906936-Karenia_brevis.AAC.1